MCLRSIDKLYRKNNNSTGIGYVVMEKRETDDFLRAIIFESVEYKHGREYKANDLYGTDWHGNSYKAGFHIWEKLEDAKYYADQEYEVIVKVMYRGIICKGEQQFEKKTIVAKNRTVLEILYEVNFKNGYPIHRKYNDKNAYEYV